MDDDDNGKLRLERVKYVIMKEYCLKLRCHQSNRLYACNCKDINKCVLGRSRLMVAYIFMNVPFFNVYFDITILIYIYLT